MHDRFSSFFVGCCYYIKAMCDHDNLIMHTLQSDIERNQTIGKNHQNIPKYLIDAVKLHIQIFEYVTGKISNENFKFIHFNLTSTVFSASSGMLTVLQYLLFYQRMQFLWESYYTKWNK